MISRLTTSMGATVYLESIHSHATEWDDDNNKFVTPLEGPCHGYSRRNRRERMNWIHHIVVYAIQYFVLGAFWKGWRGIRVNCNCFLRCERPSWAGGIGTVIAARSRRTAAIAKPHVHSVNPKISKRRSLPYRPLSNGVVRISRRASADGATATSDPEAKLLHVSECRNESKK